MTSPHRDPGLAAVARLAQIEDDVRAIKARLPEARPPIGRRRILAVCAAVAVSVLGFLVWSSFPSSRRTVMRSNAGHTVTLQFRTLVYDVELRRTPDGEPLGLLGTPTSGARWASGATVLLAPSEVASDGPTRLHLRYRAYGIEHRRVLDIDVRDEGDVGTRAILDAMPQSWVAFRRYDGQTLVYFSTLLASRSALREIRWGVDDEPLERTVRFAPDAPTISADDEIFVAVPPDTDHVRVQLTYRDGTRSVVRTILRRNAEIP